MTLNLWEFMLKHGKSPEKLKNNIEGKGAKYEDLLNRKKIDKDINLIGCAFTWRNTPEGDGYWRELDTALKHEMCSKSYSYMVLIPYYTFKIKGIA